MFDYMQDFFSFFGLNFFDDFEGAITVVDWVTWLVKVGVSLSVFKCVLRCLSDIAGLTTRGLK